MKSNGSSFYYNFPPLCISPLSRSIGSKQDKYVKGVEKPALEKEKPV